MNSQINVLIIEDDTLLAEHISQYLTRAGFHVCGTASSFDEVTEILKKQPVDIALVDINLSGPENGIIIAHELLKGKWIPIIYITGESTPAIVEKCKTTSPAAFLVKPLDMKEVAIQVELAAFNLSHGNFTPYSRENTSESIYLSSNQGYLRVKKKEILYIQADRSNSKVFLTAEGFSRISVNKATPFVQTGINMGKILAQLPSNFYRLSRSLTINLNHLDLISSDSLLFEKHQIPIPDGARPALMARLGVIKTR